MDQELNKRVAVEIMRRQVLSPKTNGTSVIPIPDYSGDIAAAWLVVEELEKRELQIVLLYSQGWSCRLWKRKPYTLVLSVQPTAPLAICHAALDICEKLREAQAAK
jgi:hypothetical protein